MDHPVSLTDLGLRHHGVVPVAERRELEPHLGLAVALNEELLDAARRPLKRVHKSSLMDLDLDLALILTILPIIKLLIQPNKIKSGQNLISNRKTQTNEHIPGGARPTPWTGATRRPSAAAGTAFASCRSCKRETGPEWVTHSMVYKRHCIVEMRQDPILGCLSYFLIVKFHKNYQLCILSIIQRVLRRRCHR